MLINVKNANNCWHFNIYEQDKFRTRAQLSWAWKKLYNLGACTILMPCLWSDPPAVGPDCWVLVFVLSLFNIWICVCLGMVHRWVGDLSCEPNNYASWPMSVGTVRHVWALQWFFYWPFQSGASFVDPFCCLCFILISVMLSCLFHAALWSPAG